MCNTVLINAVTGRVLHVHVTGVPGEGYDGGREAASLPLPTQTAPQVNQNFHNVSREKISDRHLQVMAFQLSLHDHESSLFPLILKLE